MSREQELLQKAKSRPLTDVELNELENMLERGNGDAYTILHALGHGSDRKYAPLVERYLGCEHDPMVVRIALQVLCNYWGLSERYRDRLLDFAEGVAWDDEDDVKQAAISALGEHVRRRPDDLRALHHLLAIATDESERMLLRQDAVLALLRALGQGWESMPSALDPPYPGSDQWAAAIESATARLSNR